MNIWSIYPLPSLNPLCASLIKYSVLPLTPISQCSSIYFSSCPQQTKSPYGFHTPTYPLYLINWYNYYLSFPVLRYLTSLPVTLCKQVTLSATTSPFSSALVLYTPLFDLFLSFPPIFLLHLLCFSPYMIQTSLIVTETMVVKKKKNQSAFCFPLLQNT